MFNIVKHRDFMLADNVPTWREAENLRLEKYGHDYLVVIRAEVRQRAGGAGGLNAVVIIGGAGKRGACDPA